MTNQRSEVIPYLEFLKRANKNMVRPGLWKWEDVEPQLKQSVDNGDLGEGRGAVALVNNDTQDGIGITPTLNAVFQVLKPGVNDGAHRHTNMALFLVIEGEGYSIIDGEKLEWKKGDLCVAPAWSEHEHCNTSETEDAVLFTVQDVPLVSSMGALFVEEPLGSEPRHIVKNPTKTTSK